MKTRQSAAAAEVRPLFAAVMPAAPDDATLLVTCTKGQLRELLHDAVASALEALEAERAPKPEYVSGVEMALLLGISRSTMHKLRADEGCPAVKLGDTYRFSPARVIAWLERGRGG